MKKQALAEQQRQMQMYMMQRYANQSGRNGGYNKAISSPYVTGTGQKMEGYDMSNMMPTSVDVTKRGLLGRPKRFTVNYTNPATNGYLTQPGINKTQPVVNTQQPTATKQKTGPFGGGSNKDYDESTMDKTPFANMLMKTPGLRRLGSKMVDSPDAPVTIADPIEKSYIAPKTKKAKKAYGGPIDYTEYAYGGDVSVPDLHKYQIDGQVAFDRNANAIGTTVDYKGDTIDFTGKVIKKRDSNFSLDVPELKVPGTIDKNYTNPLTGEKRAIIIGSDGKYVDNTASDLTVDPKDKKISQDFKNKLGKQDKKDIYNVGKYVADFGLDQIDQINANRQQNQMMDNLTSAETTFGVNDLYNTGTYDPNSGLFKPDQMGFTGVAKYGGGIYAMGGNTMDEDEDVQYMTEEQIKDFLANGGELEYL